MDLSKPDTLCVYCGTDLKELAQAKELLQEMVDAEKPESVNYSMKRSELRYQVISFFNRRKRTYPLDTKTQM